MTRVAVDGRVICDRYAGIGRHTLELLVALTELPDLQLVVLRDDAEQGGRLDVRPLLAHPRVESVPFHAAPVSLREQLHWRRVLRAARADVLLVPYHLATPWRTSVPTVTVIHDCIIERAPEYAPTGAARMLYRPMTRWALRPGITVATISAATAADVARFYGRVIRPDAVVPHGVGEQFRATGDAPRSHSHVRQQLGIGARFVLHVGVHRPHKNHTTLLTAFAEISRRDPEVELVLVGAPDARFPDPVPPLVRAHGLGSRVHVLPQVTEQQLLDLYAAADVFAFPSLVEGFGLPVLEALACGTPVVASDSPAVVEAAQGAAVVVPAQNAGAWAEALLAVLHDPALAGQLSERGRAVARRATWQRSAARWGALLREAAEQGSRSRARSGT